MIVDYTNIHYRSRWNGQGPNRYNGALYYSQEITRNIIPNVRTNRSWITVNVEGICADGAIVFIHNNAMPEMYEWLSDYKDLVLVCGIEETIPKVKHLGRAIHLPLSVDVDEVGRYKRSERYGTAFAGRPSKRTMDSVCLPHKTYIIEDLPRNEFLSQMARFENIYAVGRTAIEAKVLGCQVLAYDRRFPDPDIWKVLDNKDAAKILQEKLNEIDG